MSNSMKRIVNWIILLFLFIDVFFNTTYSQIAVPVNYQADLIAKVIMMNKNLKQTGKPVIMGIVYNGRFKSSVDAATELKEIFQDKGISINRLPVNILLFDVSNYTKKGLGDALTNAKLDVLYISEIRGVDLNYINNICKSNNILSIAAEPVNAEKYFTVSFDIINNNIKIIINLKSMYGENVDFSSYLLKVAKVINE
jgi:hypothetical protein